MVARDMTLGSLYDARSRLGDLIVSWTPDPNADAVTRDAQADQLKQLILERDLVNGAINAVIATEFASIPTPELMAAAKELEQATGRLDAFGRSVAEANDVIKVADTIVRGAAVVVSLASKV